MSVELTEAEVPTCVQHDTEVVMELRTIHTDSERPDQVIGHYECPECGYERRVPLSTEGA